MTPMSETANKEDRTMESEGTIRDEKQYRRGYDHGYNDAVATMMSLLQQGMTQTHVLKYLHKELEVLNDWKLSVDDDVREGRNLMDSKGFHRKAIRAIRRLRPSIWDV
jgi:uncharacterized protein (UPF0335 family)